MEGRRGYPLLSSLLEDSHGTEKRRPSLVNPLRRPWNGKEDLLSTL
jgi:hypothetical protein